MRGEEIRKTPWSTAMKTEPNTQPSAVCHPDFHTYTLALACPYTQNLIVGYSSSELQAAGGRGVLPQTHKVLSLSQDRTVLLCAAPSFPLNNDTPHQS